MYGTKPSSPIKEAKLTLVLTTEDGRTHELEAVLTPELLAPSIAYIGNNRLLDHELKMLVDAIQRSNTGLI